MKLAVMPVDLVPWDELRSLGFAAMQMFFKGTIEDESGDPSPAQIDQRLGATDLALAAMTLHIDLVGPAGTIRSKCSARRATWKKPQP